jgi:hypothetical protein
MIDWSDGDDAQYWTVVPVTENEATELARRGSELTEIEINSLGSGRRSLFRNYPTGEGPCEFWGKGITVGPMINYNSFKEERTPLRGAAHGGGDAVDKFLRF